MLYTLGLSHSYGGLGSPGESCSSAGTEQLLFGTATKYPLLILPEIESTRIESGINNDWWRRVF